MRNLVAGGLVGFATAISVAHAEPITLVAAESVYGSIAREIGGPDVAVTSVLSNPNQDPHEFEASASTARRIADARIVIYNGADYDPWMAKDIAAFENDLRSRSVKVLLYNSQTSSALAERMRTIAVAAGVPVVGVSETPPAGMNYRQWMTSQLDALAGALGTR